MYSDDQKFLLGRDALLTNFIALSLGHYESLSVYIKYYNENRLHRPLDIGNYQTLPEAFSDKKSTKVIRENNPNWMRWSQNDGAT